MGFPVLYTKKEACSILKCSPREMGRMLERGEIRYDFKRRTRIFFTREALENYLESIKVNMP